MQNQMSLLSGTVDLVLIYTPTVSRLHDGDHHVTGLPQQLYQSVGVSSLQWRLLPPSLQTSWRDH